MKTTMGSVYRLQVYKSEKVYKVPKIWGYTGIRRKMGPYTRLVYPKISSRMP